MDIASWDNKKLQATKLTIYIIALQTELCSNYHRNPYPRNTFLWACSLSNSIKTVIPLGINYTLTLSCSR